MDEWKPIDTAPKDGQWIDIWRNPPVSENGIWWASRITARWWDFDDGSSGWVWPDGDYDAITYPERANEMISNGDHYEAIDGFTNWMPPPPPPQSI